MKILNKSYFFIFLFLLSICKSISDERALNNYERIRFLYSNIIQKIISNINCNSNSIYIKIEGDTNTWIFKSTFYDALRQNNFNISDSIFNSCVINIYNETKIRYLKNQTNEDEFIREISYFVKLNNEKNEIKVYSESLLDTLKTKDLQYINNDKIFVLANDLTKKSFWDDLFEPLIILSSSGILVYLLFTIRSK